MDNHVSAEGSSPFCSKAQHIIAGLSHIDDMRLVVADGFYSAARSMEHCHPSYKATPESHLETHTCSHTDYYPDVANTGSIVAASEIACKMLSNDRLAQQLNTTSTSSGVDCRQVNMHAVALAESIAAPSTLRRFQLSGRGWCFLDDAPSAAGPLWLFADSLRLVDNGTCMTVRSPSIKADVDGLIFPGTHYCKVLSPARVLDWMMTDSLKPARTLHGEQAELLWI